MFNFRFSCSRFSDHAPPCYRLLITSRFLKFPNPILNFLKTLDKLEIMFYNCLPCNNLIILSTPHPGETLSPDPVSTHPPSSHQPIDQPIKPIPGCCVCASASKMRDGNCDHVVNTRYFLFLDSFSIRSHFKNENESPPRGASL